MVTNGVIQLVNSELFLNKVLKVDVLLVIYTLVHYLQNLGKVHFCWSFTVLFVGSCLLRDMCILDHQKVLKIFFFLTSS